jgi:hypothetical protein
MARKNLLNMNANPPEVLAIFTVERIYRVAWKLNELLEISLTNFPNVVDFPSGNHDILTFQFTEANIRVYLIGNKGTRGTMVQTKPPANYLLIIAGPDAAESARLWTSLLKEDSFFQAAHLFPQGALKTSLFADLFT